MGKFAKQVFALHRPALQSPRPWPFFRLVCALALLIGSLGAEKVADLKPSNYVNDFAGVLDAATVARQTRALADDSDVEFKFMKSSVLLGSYTPWLSRLLSKCRAQLSFSK